MCHLAMVGNISCKLALPLKLSATMDEQSFQLCFYLCLYATAEN